MSISTDCKRIELTPIGEAINGAASITIGLVPTQPLFVLKTFMMAGLRLPPLKKWWSGYPANASSGAPAEAVTFATYDVGTKILNTHREQLNHYQNFSLSFLGGAFGSPFNSALERGMILKMVKGGKYFDHMKNIYAKEKFRGFFKGTAPTIARDGGFAIGIFALNDFAEQNITPFFVTLSKKVVSYMEKKTFFPKLITESTKTIVHSDLYSKIQSGLYSGMMIGAITTPFDLTKTLIQEDIGGAKYLNFRTTVRKIMRGEVFDTDGKKIHLFTGWKARSLTIGALGCATTILKNHVPKYLPNRFRSDCSSLPEA